MSYWFVDTNLGGRNRKNPRPPGPSVKQQHVGWLALNSLYLAVAVFLFLMRPLTNAQTLGPYASTQPATEITAINAKLNGTATPNGLPSMAWFEWGTNESLDHATAPIDIGTGTALVRVTSVISAWTFGTNGAFVLKLSGQSN